MPRRNFPAARSPRPARTARPAAFVRPRLPAKPRKSLGQHFLHDEEVLERIIAEGGFGPADTVLEVGGGTGELTERLARVVGRLVTVEIDETLARFLRDRVAPYPNTRIINTDILDHDPADLLAEAGATPPYLIAGNVPYAITAPIFRKTLGARARPERLVFLVQREVAESVAAGPGKLSLLGVSVQLYGEARVLFRVPASAFTPPPRVESAVLRVDLHPQPVVEVDEDAFFRVVRAGFRNPRKQLHNALPQGLWLPPDSALDLLQEAGIDPMRRAQTLSLDEWATLTRVYLARKQEWDESRARQ